MGAWSVIYRYGLRPAVGTPTAYGVLAIKAELAYLGYSHGLNLASPDCGHAFMRAVKAFQVHEAITADGEVGPITAARLFRTRAQLTAGQYGIADDLVCNVMHQESACDPGAVGSADPTDLGLVQIHMPAHPDISEADAFTPAFALDLLGKSLAAEHRTLGDWDGAVASWNVGSGGAAAWVAAGKPASLFETWFTDQNGNQIDLGERASTYVKDVRGQRC